MRRYLARRLLLLVPVLAGVSVVIFMVLHLSPGDPVEIMLGSQATQEDRARLRAELGLDQPLHVQYGRWLGHVARGDLGRSLWMKRPVLDEVLGRFKATLVLTGTALLLSSLAGVALGVGGGDLRDLLAHLVLPAVTLAAASVTIIARLTRATMLETLGQDYIRTARAKGVVERAVVLRHGLKNALIPIVTVVGVQAGYLLGGAVLTETVFAWPGVGTLMVQGILARDFPLVQGCVLVVALSFVLVNLAVDLLYAWLDPRIRYE